MRILYGYLACFAIVFGVIGVVTLLQKILKLSGETSRKLIHALVAFTWLPMYFFMAETIHFIIVPVIFTIVNYLSEMLHIFKSMERDRGDGKHDFGTVYYAVCMVILSVLTYFFPEKLPCYGIAVFCLSFGDGAAALVGANVQKHNPQLLKGKSLLGCIACFLASVGGIYFICAVIGMQINILKVLLIALCTTVLELFGGRFDNFAVSMGITALTWFIL